MSGTLRSAVESVVESGNCSGCGACTLIEPAITMRLEGGFSRPDTAALDPVGRAEERRRRAEFRVTCPGRRVRARTTPDGGRDPILGPVVQAWNAYAVDPEIRHRGSSGGALTALAAFLASPGGGAMSGNGVTADAEDPRRTTWLTLESKETALAAAGSRYAPVAAAAHPAALDAEGFFTGKPCEVAAVRQLHDHRDSARPLLLSFFCAGTPNQAATDALVSELRAGLPPEPLDDLWYRGRGWPGAFTVSSASGVRSTSYEASWGRALGPAVQWRCKICPDGVGESSDITAADFWVADERGYPSFDEKDGRSALLARTERGRQAVLAAVAAGALKVEPLRLTDLVGMQPLQDGRRRMLLGRLIGARSTGRSVPRFRGFSLWRLAGRQPRQTWRAARGTRRRLRR